MDILSVMFGKEHEYFKSVEQRFDKCRKKLKEHNGPGGAKRQEPYDDRIGVESLEEQSQSHSA